MSGPSSKDYAELRAQGKLVRPEQLAGVMKWALNVMLAPYGLKIYARKVRSGRGTVDGRVRVTVLPLPANGRKRGNHGKARAKKK